VIYCSDKNYVRKFLHPRHESETDWFVARYLKVPKKEISEEFFYNFFELKKT